MIDKNIFKKIILNQKEDILKVEGTIRREILDEILQFKDNRVIIITGVRRAGKSTLLKQMMGFMNKYCYVNFEDERFLDFKAQDFEDLNEILMEIYDEPRIYFFDEIQNIDKFESFVRRLQDQGKKVIITGSNAALLSKEFGTKLTGRYKLFEVYTFSFREYLSFKKINPEKNWAHLTEKRILLKKQFNEYLIMGGFPEYLKNRDKEYIKNLFENILYKDIITRYSIKKEKLIKELISILTTNISSTFTYNSLKKAIGLSNAITVKEYISYLSNSYLLFELQKFDFSIKKSLNSPKKIYLVDNAFNQVIGLNFSSNIGRNLENVVFLHLKRNKKEIYYGHVKYECDFLIKEGTKIKQAIQVCYNLNKKDKEREINGLKEVITKFKLKEGLLLTYDQEEEIKINNKKIIVKPVWKWLLEEL